MNIIQAKDKLDKIDWYNQGAAVKPLYISYPIWSCFSMRMFGKIIPVKYNIYINIRADFMDNYISFESLQKVANFYLNKQKKDNNFIKKFEKNWKDKYVKKYLRCHKFLLDSDFKKLSNNEIDSYFKEYSKLYLAVWDEVIFLDGFDFAGEKILEYELNREGKEIDNNEIEILTTPSRLSFIQRKNLEILSFLEKNKIGGIIKDENLTKISKLLSGKYYWLHNDYSQVEFLDKKFFRAEIMSWQKNKEKIYETKNLKRNLSVIKQRKKEISAKYNLSGRFLNITEFFGVLANLRDERKAYNQLSGNVLEKFVWEFSKRNLIKKETVENLFFWEIQDAFNLEREKIKLAVKREKGGGFYFFNAPGKFESCFLGKSGQELNNFLKNKISLRKELKGKPAFKGKTVGLVRIIKTKNDFSKMKAGDILVAPNTRPEYVPIMRIAGGIVTDEGGITSHAAIISRELGIPCIVGVQGATTILKDGVKILVDADKGIIKTIES